MCGIAGYFAPADGTPLAPDLDRMMQAMRHRGPDGDGVYRTPDRRYQAGFVRLSIIDLATGDQPIVSDDERIVLLGNGEIYNYVELRENCRSMAYPYRTQGDMEVTIPLWRRDGDDFVEHLNGMYGLALFDRAAHRLLLVRDRLGVKPLYWARTRDGGVVYASEIKPLFASGLVRAEIDEAAVSAYLAHGYVPAPDTLFAGVKKLPPGCCLRVGSDGATALTRYWRAAPDADALTSADDAEARLLELLKDSVRLQLRSDVPVGALLSGGIDSGLMVALAAEATDRPLQTFTVRFEGAAVDETPLAAAVAARYGTRHTEIDVRGDSASALLPRLAWHCDEPLSDAALLPNALIEEQLGRAVKVALNGTGGDELFAGYGRYFQLPVERRYLTIPGPLRRGVVEPLVGLVSPMRRWQLARAAKFDASDGGYLHDHSTYFPGPMRALIGNRMAPPPAAQAAAFADAEGPTQTRMLAADIATYLPEDLLTLLDRTSMAHGVEGRVPLLDHRLVAAALAVPPAIRTPGGRQKALQRRLAQRYLPDDVVNAPKQGFASPVPHWMRAGMSDTAVRILTRRESLERNWWSADGIRRLAGDPGRHAFRLYTLLMLELAVRLHAETNSTAAPPEASLEAFADVA